MLYLLEEPGDIGKSSSSSDLYEQQYNYDDEDDEEEGLQNRKKMEL